MPDSLKVIYTPTSNMPSNMPANFQIPGWGHVVLEPYKEEELALVLTQRILKQVGHMVRLVDANDWVHMGPGFEHLNPNPPQEVPPVTTEQPAHSPEPNLVVASTEEPETESAPFSKPKTKPAKVGDK